jgi:hypothetical protein
MPEVDADFAKSLGVADGDVARLRDEIRTNLAREAKRRVQAKVKEQVLNGLLEATPIDVPSNLVAMERTALMEKAVTDLKARGMKEADIKLSDSVFEPQAKRRVCLGLLMDTIVIEQKIIAGEEQVRAMVDEFAHHEVQLQIGHGLGGVALQKGTGFCKVAGEHAAALAAPFAHRLEGAPSTDQRQAKQLGAPRHVDHLHHVHVVLQVLAHSRQLVQHTNAVVQQLGVVANA